MQLSGQSGKEVYLNSIITSLNNLIDTSSRPQSEKDKLRWNQLKIDKVWTACRDFDTRHSVQIHPRLLIAIIRKEGTGSFNTDAANTAADGQNGANLDFDDDLSKALDLLAGKIIAYSHFQEEFSNARESAYKSNVTGISDYDDILHYLNWETPRLQILSKKFSIVVYAGNNTWHRGVREFYSNLAYEDAPQDYTEYAVSLGSNIM